MFRLRGGKFQIRFVDPDDPDLLLSIENFKQMLEPDELELFEKEVLTKDTRKMWKEEKKKQKVKA